MKNTPCHREGCLCRYAGALLEHSAGRCFLPVVVNGMAEWKVDLLALDGVDEIEIGYGAQYIESAGGWIPFLVDICGRYEQLDHRGTGEYVAEYAAQLAAIQRASRYLGDTLIFFQRYDGCPDLVRDWERFVR